MRRTNCFGNAQQERETNGRARVSRDNSPVSVGVRVPSSTGRSIVWRHAAVATPSPRTKSLR